MTTLDDTLDDPVVEQLEAIAKSLQTQTTYIYQLKSRVELFMLLLFLVLLGVIFF